MQVETRGRLREALEHVLAALHARRQQHEQEADLGLTNAYGRLILAASFARLGEHHRARELAAESRAVLKPRAGDAIHGLLLAAFASHLDALVAGERRQRWLIGDLRRRIDELDRVSRFKIDRFRELMPGADARTVDAIGAFARRSPQLLHGWEALDEAARIAYAERALAEDLASCLDIIETLPDAPAMELLARALPLVNDDALLAAHAIDLAARAGWGELVAAPFEVIRARTRADVDPDRTAKIVELAGSGLRRLGLRDELRALVAVLAAIGVDDRTSLALLVGGMRSYREGALDPVLAEAIERRHADLEPRRVRQIARGLALARVADAVDGCRRLTAVLSTTRDVFGTSSHFSVSVLDVVASLCLIVDEVCED